MEPSSLGGAGSNGGDKQEFDSQAWMVETCTRYDSGASPGGETCPSPSHRETGGVAPQTTMPTPEIILRSDLPDTYTSWFNEESSFEAGMQQQTLPAIETRCTDAEAAHEATDYHSCSNRAAVAENANPPPPGAQYNATLLSAGSYSRTTPTAVVASPRTGTATANNASLYNNNASLLYNSNGSIGSPPAAETYTRNTHPLPAHYGSRKNEPVGEADGGWEGVTAVPAMLPGHPADRFLAAVAADAAADAAAAAAAAAGGGGGGGGDDGSSYGACGGEHDEAPTRLNKGNGGAKSNGGGRPRLPSSLDVSFKYFDSSEDELDKEARRAAVAASRERRVQNRSVVRAHPFLGMRVKFAPLPVYCLCGHCQLCTSWRFNLWRHPAEPDDSDIFSS